jgi:FMN phosphatase YigB (HAD superfamily)
MAGILLFQTCFRRTRMTTFLIDLDGTLLTMDVQAFSHAYFGALSRHLAGVVDPHEFPTKLMAVTSAMQNDLRPDIGNVDKFKVAFERMAPGLDLSVFWNRMTEFYEGPFDTVRSVVAPNEPVVRAVRYLQNRGQTVVLATNPIFPAVATCKRLMWAGFEPKDFAWVSTMENSRFCKPHVEYWRDVLTAAGADAAASIAVGNDAVEDVSARLAGIATCLVTDYAIGDTGSAGADRVVDGAGFEQWVRETY